MIRRLEEKDRKEVLEFLSDEAAINLFIIGDIEAYGFDEEFQTLWGQYTDDGVLEGVLLRFHENFIPYFNNPSFDITEFVNIILNNQGKTMISGKESLLRKFEEVLPKHTSGTTYFCELRHPDNLSFVDNNSSQVKIAQECDAERVYEFIDKIDEFKNRTSVDRIKHKIKTKAGRIYYIENDDGRIVSVAQTTAENSKSAMVVGVDTLEEYRNHGLMSTCLSRLCQDVLAEGKGLCLFYDNPKAGKIYHKFGFETIDNWMMIEM